MKKHLKTNYKVGGMVVIIAMLAFIFPSVCNANLQSRPNATSLVSKTASEFFLLCRQMETANGPLGLNATITADAEAGTITEGGSNGIDVHMIKNTEYGTAAMLAASAYGKCPQGSASGSSDTTTGNKSGIMQMASGEYEYVAGILNPEKVSSSVTNNGYIKYIAKADAKYKDVYDSDTKSETSYKPGDATYETQKWRGAPDADWVSSGHPVFRRSYSGVFFFDNYDGGSDSYYGSRAAVVCGAGL